jgi:hypothetical protein
VKETQPKKGGEKMTKAEPTLPSNRAFVVQFRAATDVSSRQCTGRVEHLVSGQATHFESWEHLRGFVERVLISREGTRGYEGTPRHEHRNRD